MPETSTSATRRFHARHPWGRLFLAPGAAEPPSIAREVTAAAEALARLWGRAPATPLDLTLDPSCLVPSAWPEAVPPRLLLPSPPVRPCRTADLVHELAHLVAFVPRARLLSEGMAVASAYRLAADGFFPVAGDARALDDHARSARRPPLSSLTEGGAAAADLCVTGRPLERHRVAYAVAGSFAQYLIAVRGAARLLDVLDRLAAEPGLSQQDALEDAYGRPLDGLEAGWLSRTHGPEARP